MSTESAPNPDNSRPASPGPATGAPPLGARIVAFSAILIAGLCGGLIGFGFAKLQCEGACGLQKGGFSFVGAIGAAVGVAIISVLTLRAMGEWSAGGKRQD